MVEAHAVPGPARDRILEAAERVVAEVGAARLTLDVVAQARHADDQRGVRGACDLDLILADADGFDDDDVVARRLQGWGDAVPRRAVEPESGYKYDLHTDQRRGDR